ncbi:hypothetical protein SAMN05216228_104439 [Rhizobium tibeticum]|uniref:Transposase n=1 Tax=Rhizobium tibeticum TaxID=501024 RepID=A0A1H8VMH3_9HYPH|nr:hypothetical protein RTCCBAU85039_4659 [Rhizobium tibeticum]SEP16520.1 hypothetical protein SAMN05216228_104439 [Rhizobium tibeticum]
MVKWSQRHRATGSVRPGKMGGRRKRILEPHRGFIAERLEQNPHLTNQRRPSGCSALAKLGREDDAYHCTCPVLMEYSSDPIPLGADEEKPSNGIREQGVQPIADPAEDEIAHLAAKTLESFHPRRPDPG